MSGRWERSSGPGWWQRFEPTVGTVTVGWRSVNGIDGWYLTNATTAVQVLLDGQTRPERNPAPLATADAVLRVLADARAARGLDQPLPARSHGRPFEVPMVVAFPGDPEEWRRIRFVVPADRSVPPVGTSVSVPVESGWLDLGIIAAGRVVDGGVELTLELHEDLAPAGGADTNESVA